MDKTTTNPNRTRHELGGLESFSRAIALGASALFLCYGLARWFRALASAYIL